jgi:hypothetical protein
MSSEKIELVRKNFADWIRNNTPSGPKYFGVFDYNRCCRHPYILNELVGGRNAQENVARIEVILNTTLLDLQKYNVGVRP